MTNTRERMENFERHLTGGLEHGTLHMLEHDENGDEIVMFMMDAEYDPVRITYGGDGEISIHADGHQYHMFTVDQLQFIASKSPEAIAMWEEYFEENPVD
jgi:hypothetical protein